MKKINNSLKFLFSIFFLLLLISGCSSGNVKMSDPCISGKDGLSMNLIPNSPPRQIFENERFQIGLELRNNGCYEIDDLILKVYGYTNFIEKKDESAIIVSDLIGKTKTSPVGGYKIKTIDFKNVKMPLDQIYYSEKFFIDACYKYSTTLSTDICINPSLTTDTSSRAYTCNMRDLYFSAGQAAPVGISKITSRILRGEDENELILSFYVYNYGPGVVRDYRTSCNSIGSVVIENIEFSDYSFTNGRIECNPLFFQLKSEREGYFECRAILDPDISAFQTPLTLTISYGYEQTLSTEVEIKRLGE